MGLSVWIAVDASGARRRFDLLTDSWKDLTPVLSELSKYKQGKIAELFAQPVIKTSTQPGRVDHDLAQT